MAMIDECKTAAYTPTYTVIFYCCAKLQSFIELKKKKEKL